MYTNKKYFKIVKLINKSKGRCIECDARNICHMPQLFNCRCGMFEHYKFDIIRLRKDKIKNINNKYV